MNESGSHAANIQIQPKHVLLTPSSSTSSASVLAPSISTSTSVSVHHHQHHHHHHHHQHIQQQHQQQRVAKLVAVPQPQPRSHSYLHHQPSGGSPTMAAYGGDTPNSIKRHVDMSDCSSSTSSCSSSAASVAGDIGVRSAADAPGQAHPAVINSHGSTMMAQKVSRTIPSDKINLRLILVSGKTKEFLFNPSDSAGDIAQTVFDNWPEDWEREAVSKAEILRLIYQGRFLHCNVTLGALGLPLGKTTVMHLVPRDNLPEPNSQDQRQKSKGGSSRCCSTTCCIL